ncbi:MAG TPA: DUF3152 domain-containing protein [Candidatus Saccharimonadales bacterium]|nr:DUF3152 domain-containing protein [Candidatus Saccharimonadales bacterium]
MKHKWLLPLLAFFGLALSFLTPVHAGVQQQITLNCDEVSSLYCPVTHEHELSDALTNLQVPLIMPPESTIFTPALNVRKPITRTVTYHIETRGTITADLAQFKTQTAETYTDSRGWSRLGVAFKEVESGGDFTLVLSAANSLPDFGYPCDSSYSCQTGRYVIINQDRWLGATEPWNQAGGDLRNYRHMVVNHETGHWLGHGHTTCSGAGQAATVMMQQSINLGGCKFNPWPLDSEIWSTRLGI